MEHRRQLLEHAEDGWRVEARIRVIDAERELPARYGDQVEQVVRLFQNPGAADRQASWSALEQVAQWIVLEHEQGVEQGGARWQLAPLLDLHKRGILIGLFCRLLRLQLPQPLQRRHLR